MPKTFADVARECILDLGMAVVYAALVGFVIVAIVASDHESISLLHATLYASLLPLSVLGLIGVDLILRLVSEPRDQRRRTREF